MSSSCTELTIFKDLLWRVAVFDYVGFEQPATSLWEIAQLSLISFNRG